MTVVMLVLAMRIMMMIGVIVRMIVARVMPMPVVVMRLVVAPMVVVPMILAGAGGISAAFGIERRLDLDYARAKPLHHLLDHVVAPDAQTPGHDLRRQMAVAEMPSDPDQVVRIGAANFQQRFRRRDHLDQPAVVEHQRVAAPERNGVFQIEQKLKPARAGHRHAPPVPVVEIEHDGVDWSLLPAMLT
jgi:hypothetical protein